MTRVFRPGASILPLLLAVAVAPLWPAAAVAAAEGTKPASSENAPPSVTVVPAERRELVETTPVTGTLVPRDEVLVFAETDGLRVVDVLAEEGDKVRKGQVLARLARDVLDVQLQQNVAAVARAEAAVAQAKSQITQAEAGEAEAAEALKRAEALLKSGNATQATYEQRLSAARSSAAALAAARSGLTMAEAAQKTAEAQRREIDVRIARTEVKAPADGIVSRKAVRLGQTAAAGAGDPLFRIIRDGAIELEGEVVETRLARIREGANATVSLDAKTSFEGSVRLVMPEVDRTTRLGKVRIALPADDRLRIGSFARGSIELARREGVAVPLSAVQFSVSGTVVQVVAGGKVQARNVETGLVADGRVEILKGVAEGEKVVARAGGFLRDGDIVTPVDPAATDRTKGAELKAEGATR